MIQSEEIPGNVAPRKRKRSSEDVNRVGDIIPKEINTKVLGRKGKSAPGGQQVGQTASR